MEHTNNRVAQLVVRSRGNLGSQAAQAVSDPRTHLVDSGLRVAAAVDVDEVLEVRLEVGQAGLQRRAQAVEIGVG